MRSVLALRYAVGISTDWQPHIYKWTTTLAYILCVRLDVRFSTEQATHLGSIYIALHVAIVLRKHSASLLTTPHTCTDWLRYAYSRRETSQAIVYRWLRNPSYIQRNSDCALLVYITSERRFGFTWHHKMLPRVVYWLVKERWVS